MIDSTPAEPFPQRAQEDSVVFGSFILPRQIWYNPRMATTGPSSASFPDFQSLRRFSSSDYLQMVEAGVLGPEDHVELIGGMIVEMSPAGARHNYFLGQLNRLFAPLWDQCEIRVQGTLDLSEGQVYDPDIMLLRSKPGDYKEQLPQADDVLLVIEASESSLQRDQQVKLPVYAAAGIQDYWIADLKKEVMLVHRDPTGTEYRSVETFGKNATITPLAAPEFAVELAKVFN